MTAIEALWVFKPIMYWGTMYTGKCGRPSYLVVAVALLLVNIYPLLLEPKVTVCYLTPLLLNAAM